MVAYLRENRGVELRVQDEGEDILIYALKGIDEAAEMFNFLKGFFPGAKFVIQPILN